jgi:hypothetical protein
MTHPHPRALEAAAIEGSDAFKAALRVMIERDPTRVPAAAVLRDAIVAYLAEAGDGWMPINTIPMPRNAEEARAMVLLGERWLSDNAAPPAAAQEPRP